MFISNDKQFGEKLISISNYICNQMSEGALKDILCNRISAIKNCVLHSKELKYSLEGYVVYRAVYEEKGGEEFLNSSEGLDFIGVCHYFVNTYYPSHFPKK